MIQWFFHIHVPITKHIPYHNKQNTHNNYTITEKKHVILSLIKNNSQEMKIRNGGLYRKRWSPNGNAKNRWCSLPSEVSIVTVSKTETFKSFCFNWLTENSTYILIFYNTLFHKEKVEEKVGEKLLRWLATNDEHTFNFLCC